MAGTGVNAWIVERDSQPVADYAATWLRDAGIPEGPEFDAAMGQWLDAFADESAVEAHPWPRVPKTVAPELRSL